MGSRLDRHGLLFELLAEDIDQAKADRIKVEKKLQKLSSDLDVMRARERRLLTAQQQFEPSLEGFDAHA
jgi:hypothetical protein